MLLIYDTKPSHLTPSAKNHLSPRLFLLKGFEHTNFSHFLEWRHTGNTWPLSWWYFLFRIKFIHTAMRKTQSDFINNDAIANLGLGVKLPAPSHTKIEWTIELLLLWHEVWCNSNVHVECWISNVFVTWYTLREEIFAGINFRDFLFRIFRGNQFSRIWLYWRFRGN